MMAPMRVLQKVQQAARRRARAVPLLQVAVVRRQQHRTAMRLQHQQMLTIVKLLPVQLHLTQANRTARQAKVLLLHQLKLRPHHLQRTTPLTMVVHLQMRLRTRVRL